jgi:nicotinamide-nucleotide adenylyltransferase
MNEREVRARLYDLSRIRSHRRAVRSISAASDPRSISIASPGVSNVRRLGLLPGSFNPPTIAHTTLASAGLASGVVDAVLFSLSTRTVDKEEIVGAALEDRLLLLELIADADPRFGVALVNRGLYVEQAELARTHVPDVEELYFLLGFDKIVQILDPRYYDDRDAALRRLFGLASILVAPRGDAGSADLEELLARPENREFTLSIRPINLPPDLRDVASSDIRRSVGQGRSAVEDLAPDVWTFVHETGAYDLIPDRYRARLAALDNLEQTGECADLEALATRPMTYPSDRTT